jgi:Osmosensitive K+ channel His kinase sensor domain
MRGVSTPAAEREATTGDTADAVEAAGHFRIYLGAAAGVGKTYAMLNEGHRRKQRGTDVVVGFVECHGRRLTEEMIGDLEVVPRKVVDYRGSRLEEMDLDAVLPRSPSAPSRPRSMTPSPPWRVSTGWETACARSWALASSRRPPRQPGIRQGHGGPAGV